MSVRIRRMTDEEFAFFYQWSVEQTAREQMAVRHISQSEAVKETKEEVDGMLPDGMNTAHHCLMTIEKEYTQENLGAIWTLHEETEGRKQSFLCDFVIWEPKRRNGYATEALRLMEKSAVEAGCRESVLYVADSNAAARALYEKSGYQVLRQENDGKYMAKQL